MNREKLLSLAASNSTLKKVAFKDSFVYLKRLSITNNYNMKRDVIKRSESIDSSAMEVLLYYTLCDENGNRMLTEADMDVIANTEDKDFLELIEQAVELNFGVSDAQVEEIKKN